MDPEATNGIDTLLDLPIPDLCIGPNNCTDLGQVAFLSHLSGGPKLAIDYRGFEAELTWSILLEFGDREKTGAESDEITLSWADDDGASLFDSLPYNRIELLDGNNTKIDMRAITTRTFLKPDRTVQIVLENQTPVARDETFSLLTNSLSEPLSVLANDTDDNMDKVVITEIANTKISTTENGTIFTENGTIFGSEKSIFFTPNSNFTGTESFPYTIFDGISNSTATVTIFIGDIVFNRRVDTNTSVGQDLPIDIEIRYIDAIMSEEITLVETFPGFDDFSGFYSIPPGDGTNGLAISGFQPDSVLVERNVVTFKWNSSGNNSLPPNTFTMQYKLRGDVNDRDPKIISGIVNYGNNSDGPNLDTTFELSQFHPADTNQDSVIDSAEFLDYVGPIADVFQLGVEGGKYCWNGITLAPNLGEDCTGRFMIHPADLNENGVIEGREFLDYVGPPADVFQLGSGGGEYCWDGISLSPKPVNGCDL